eukprot:GFUD01115792.1.p1 GENE.GFUD01115792.1~~GFUD01115792.1.p1  ORF type:complete len:131 (-),score=34.54 GFUD01115792.1:49-441(-)
MQHSQVLVLLCIFLSSSLAYGPYGVPAWQQWIPGSGYGEEFFVATNATNDASCAVEFFTNVTVYMGDPNCNSTVYENVDQNPTMDLLEWRGSNSLELCQWDHWQDMERSAELARNGVHGPNGPGLNNVEI